MNHITTPPRTDRSRTHSRRWLLLAALTAVTVAPLAACKGKTPKARAVPAGATVLALGDSLTSGVGAAPDTAYPARLAQLTSWNVVNAGVSGHTSAQAQERLAALLAQHSPALVIVSIGGNDFLRRQSAADTRANVRRICAEALASGAQVLLVAVPELSLLAAAGRLSDHAMYEEIAGELKIPLHRKGWAGVLANESLRADNVHANAAGYEQFALGLTETLRETGLLVR